MDELPETQTQEDYVEPSQELLEIRRPWGRLSACKPTLQSVDLFDTTYTLGRAPTCNIIIDKAHFSTTILNVSKEHFTITKASDTIFLTDLSKNGTFINMIKVGKNNKHIIYNDDVIAIGHPKSTVYCFSCNVNREDFEYLPREMRQRYFVSKLLGRGAFGEVRLAQDKRSFHQYAIKRINKGGSSTAREGSTKVSHPQKMATEVKILTSLSYAFIIQMKEVYETDTEIFLILEYMKGGELTRRIKSSAPFPENEVKFVFYQILLGVRYLHIQGVTHRDLKPENVLLSTCSPYPMVKITDFGLSKIMDEISLMETVCGTVQYAAPELLHCVDGYTRKVDVWSLGVLLFYMLCKAQPFIGPNRESIARNVIKGTITWDAKAWKGISLASRNLVKSMLILNPDRRFSVADIFKHEWIEKDIEMQYRVDQFVNSGWEETDTSEESLLPLSKKARLGTCSR